MKIFIGLWLVGSVLYSQTKESESCIQYKFILECPIFRCDIQGNKLDTLMLIAEPGSRFTLISQDNEICIIRFKTDDRQKKTKNPYSRYSNFKYYKLSKEQFDFKTKEDEFKKWGIAVGNVITPIKLKLQPFSFSKDFSIGPTLGAKFMPRAESVIAYNFLSSFGVTSITLDDFNTLDEVEDPLEVLAFTVSGGIMMEHKTFQFGIFAGVDILNSGNSYAQYYIYNKKPWISVGFGYSIFNSN